MAKTILLLCGHKNITTITSEGLRSWRSVTSLKASTGGSGERDWIWNQLMPMLRDRLIAKTYEVYVTDAVYHADIYSRDYDLCLALHYDGGGTDSRCIISNPNETVTPPYIYPESQTKAKAFMQKWLEVYPVQTGITSRQDRVTPGMTDYYAWDYIKEGTPAVIIEHGNNTCPSDHDKMFNHVDLIADATVEAVERYFGPVVVDGDNYYRVYYKGAELTPHYETNPKDTIASLEATVTTVKGQLADTTKEVELLRREIDTQDALEKQLIAERDAARRERDEISVTSEKKIAEMTNAWQDERKGLQGALDGLTSDNAKLVKQVETLKAQASYSVVRKLVGGYYLVKRK